MRSTQKLFILSLTIGMTLIGRPSAAGPLGDMGLSVEVPAPQVGDMGLRRCPDHYKAVEGCTLIEEEHLIAYIKMENDGCRYFLQQMQDLASDDKIIIDEGTRKNAVDDVRRSCPCTLDKGLLDSFITSTERMDVYNEIFYKVKLCYGMGGISPAYTCRLVDPPFNACAPFKTYGREVDQYTCGTDLDASPPPDWKDYGCHKTDFVKHIKDPSSGYYYCNRLPPPSKKPACPKAGDYVVSSDVGPDFCCVTPRPKIEGTPFNRPVPRIPDLK